MSATDSSPSVLRVERHNRVIELVFDRPDRLNAMDAALIHALGAALADAGKDPDVRVVVLRGEGRAFRVGADVKRADAPGETYGAAHSAADDYARLDDRAKEMFLSIVNCPIPVIAEVHGYCMGMSTILIQCCDLVYCADDAVLGWPTVPLGGGMIGPVWAHTIGPRRAKELSFLIGSRISGSEAAEWGIANRAVPADALRETVTAVAARVALLSRDLLRIKKSAINQVQARDGFTETLRLGPIWDAAAHETEITRETVQAIATDGLRATVDKWRH